MKNFHKVRGKREFLFDDRELLVLGGGGLVICALIFTLGFMMGQSLDEQSDASPLLAGDSVIEGDFEAGEPQGLDEESGFSGDTQQQAAPLEDSPGMEKSEKSYFTVLPDKETYVEVEATPVRDSNPEPVEQTEQTQQAEAPEAVAPQEQALQAATPIPPGSTTAGQVQNQDMVDVPALPNVPGNPSDEMQVGRQSPRVGASEEPLPDGTIYSVQVASSPNREDSERLVRKYGDQGYQAYIMQADLGDKGIWYRVRVGNRSSRAEAMILKSELEQKLPDLANSPYVIKVAE